MHRHSCAKCASLRAKRGSTRNSRKSPPWSRRSRKTRASRRPTRLRKSPRWSWTTAARCSIPVICEYLDSLHAGRKFFPATGPARWTALRLQATGDGILDAGVLCRYEMAIRPKEYQWEGWIAGQKTKWHGGLDLLEREVATLDGEPTIGGITVGCALGWLDFRYCDDDWRNKRPKLASWFEKFSARSSMKATMPSV